MEMTERWLELEGLGRPRRALLQGRTGPGPVPLVLALHGTGGTPRLMAKLTGLSARTPGLVLYPAALGSRAGRTPPGAPPGMPVLAWAARPSRTRTTSDSSGP